MSTGDKRKDFQALGNSISGEIILLEDNGKIWLYNGYNLDPFYISIKKNITYIKSLTIQDSTVYALTSDALLRFQKTDERPIVLNKSNDHYFFTLNSTNYYYADGINYKIHKGKIKPITNLESPTHKYNYITSSLGENVYIHKSRLIWDSGHSHIIAKSKENDISDILLDQWENTWAIQDKKLHKVIFNRSKSNPSEFRYNGNHPDKIWQLNNSVVGVYDQQLVKWTNNQNKVIYKSTSKVQHVFSDSENDLWIVDKNKLTLISGDQNFSWKIDDILPDDEIVGVTANNGIKSICFRNEGIYQTKKMNTTDEWIWVRHRLNSKLKNLSILALSQKEKTYLFSENYGIFTVNKNEIGTIRKNFPSYGIQEVRFKKNYAILLDKGKRFHFFDFGQKSLKKIKTPILPPEIEGNQFLLHNDKIIYKSFEQLVFLDVYSGNFYSWDYAPDLENSFIENDYLFSFSDSPKKFIIPSGTKKSQTPIVRHIELLHSTNEKTDLLDFKRNTISLEENDFPIEMQIQANYPSDPKNIEYSWISNDQDFSKDFSFDGTKKIKNPGPGSFKIYPVVKYNDFIDTLKIPTLIVSKSIVQEDYTWAIYLSAIFAGLLLISILYARYRSNKQKRKIKELEWEKKTIELEQKALQLQMNPHFIFNAMNGVKGLIAQGEDKKARQYLTKISSWMRSMLQDSREEAIPIEKEINNLKTYLEIERELRGNVWNYEIHVDESTGLQYKIPPMMIQPFVENAIIHAFKKIDYLGKIDIRIVQKGRRLHVEIEDNGQGIHENTSKHKSLALEVIRDRLKIFQDGTEKKFFQLINKEDVDKSRTGVIVRLILPIV